MPRQRSRPASANQRENLSNTGNRTSLLGRLANSNLTLSVAQKTSLAFDKLAPDWTYRRAENRLLSPHSRKIDLSQLPYGIAPLDIDTRHGRIQGYHLGQGPAVVLVHGWNGGAHQFFPLMRGLAECGFRAISFDHFGHGHSSGERASLITFIDGVNAVLKFANRKVIAGLAGIVAHSMGTVALANVEPDLIGHNPLLMIAPVFRFRDYFARMVNLGNLHPDLCNQYIARFERSHEIDYDNVGLLARLPQYAEQTILVHDKLDQISPFRDSLKFISANPATRLNALENWGHERIILSESVWLQLKNMLNYRDIRQQVEK